MTEADVNTEVDTMELPHQTTSAEDGNIVTAVEETAARKAGVKAKRTAKAVEKEKVNPEALAAEVTSADEPAAEVAIQAIDPAAQVTKDLVRAKRDLLAYATHSKKANAHTARTVVVASTNT